MQHQHPDVVQLNLTDDARYRSARYRFMFFLETYTVNATKEEKQFYLRGKDLLDAIDARKKTCDSKGGFNYKVHTEILLTATQMLDYPGNETLHAQLNQLAHVKNNDGLILDGQQSSKKIWAGVGLICVAAAAFTAAAACFAAIVVLAILLLGLPAAVVPFGLWQAVIGCAASGVGLSIAGSALLYSGRERGTLKAVHNFDDARLAAAQHQSTKATKPGLFNNDFLQSEKTIADCELSTDTKLSRLG